MNDKATPRAVFEFASGGELLSQNQRARDFGWPPADAGLAARLAQAMTRLRMFPEQEIRFVDGDGPAELDCRVQALGDQQDRRFSVSLLPSTELDSTGESNEQVRWRYALDNAEDGLWDWRAGSPQVFRSARCLSMLGYQPGDVADSVEAWHELVHPDDRGRQQGAIAEHLKGGSSNYKVEYRIRHASGQWRWLLDRGKVIYWSPDGRPQRVVGTHTDITNYKELEQRLRERELLLDEAQRVGQIGSWALDPASKNLWWSTEMYRIVGWPAERPPPDLEAQRSLYAPESYARLLAALNRTLADGEPLSMELTLLRPDGERRLVEMVSDAIRGDTGEVQRILGVVHDVTDERQATEAARWRSKLLDRIAAMGRIGGFDLDINSGRFQWTDENYRIHGIEPGTPVSVQSLMSQFDGTSQARLSTAINRLTGELSSEETVEVEFITDDQRRLILRVTAIMEQLDGKPWRITGLTQDITEEREAGERIEQLAHFDMLTGLPNRFLFRQRAIEAIRVAQRAHLALGLLFVDLDRFKYVNDTLGHAAGDQLLQEVAGRLKTCLRGSDLIARQGGDEFTVMLCEMRKPEDAALVAEKIIAAVGLPVLLGDTEVQVGCSIGIALLSDKSSDLDSLMRAADSAMYAAKENGRNMFQFYNDSFYERVHRRGLLEQELRQAVARNELFLVYQPTVSLAEHGKVICIEALLRWQRPGGELRVPLEFLPIAQDTGDIVPIGLWALEQACRQARAWELSGLVFSSMAVNVWAAQLRDPEFAGQVLEICRKTHWQPSRLVLELAESALIRDTDVLRGAFATFESHGINVAVDDFGTGFSHLMSLKGFPVRHLKIDRSFVRQMLEDPHVGVLTQAVINMGHSMGLTVTGQGVEDEGSLLALRNQGCDEVQGFHLTRPLSAGDLEAWIRARC